MKTKNLLLCLLALLLFWQGTANADNWWRYRASYDDMSLTSAIEATCKQTEEGLTIVDIKPGGMADRYGFEIGDAILKIEGMETPCENDFCIAIHKACKKTSFVIQFRRDHKDHAKVIQSQDVNCQPQYYSYDCKWLGITVAETKDGLQIIEITPEATEAYGFEIGDVILKIEGKETPFVSDFIPALCAVREKSNFSIQFRHNSEDKAVVIPSMYYTFYTYTPGIPVITTFATEVASVANTGGITTLEAFGAKVKGNVIKKVISDSPADEAGLQKGDKILNFNGKKIKTAKDLEKAVEDSPVDAELTVRKKGEGKAIIFVMLNKAEEVEADEVPVTIDDEEDLVVAEEDSTEIDDTTEIRQDYYPYSYENQPVPYFLPRVTTDVDVRVDDAVDDDGYIVK